MLHHSRHDPAKHAWRSGPRTRRCRVGAPVLALSIGIIVSAWQTLTSGFRLVQEISVNPAGELHPRAQLSVAGGHALAEDLWSPPIFFPVRNVASTPTSCSVSHRCTGRGGGSAASRRPRTNSG